MNKQVALSKFKAVSIHFLISLLILFGFLYVMLTQWYPLPYFYVDQGWSGIRIMILVDLVLGPTITAIIFYPTKTRKALTFDFSVIAIIQIIALIWGGNIVYEQRAVAYVFYDSAFRPVIMKSLKKQGVSEDKLRVFSGEKPPLIYRDVVKSREEGKRQIFWISKGVLPHGQYYFFKSLKQNRDRAFAYHLDIKTQSRNNRELARELTALLARLNKNVDQLYFMALFGRDKRLILAFDHDGNKVGHLRAPFALKFISSKQEP